MVTNTHYGDYDIPRSASEVKRTLKDSAAQSQKNEGTPSKLNHHAVSKQGSHSPKGPLVKLKSVDNTSKHVSYFAESSVCFVNSSEHIYETNSTEPIYECTELDNKSLSTNTSPAGSSIYENTEFMRESLKRKSSSPAILKESPKSKRPSSKKENVLRHKSTPGIILSQKKPKRHTPDDYEDPDGILDDTEHYYTDVDRDKDLHDMYVDPEDLRMYADMDDVRKGIGSSSSASSDNIISAALVKGQRKHLLLFFVFLLLFC